jgi:GT2 family glycosyltransferase
MIIQGLICDIKDNLYTRYTGGVRLITNNALEFDNGAILETDTYFNSCSVGKWFYYCDIEGIQLKIRYSGDFKFEVFYSDYGGEVCTVRTLVSVGLKSDMDKKSEYMYQIEPLYSGVVYYRLTALCDKARLYSAVYDAVSSKPERNIAIALNICTYKREQFLMRNIRLLEEKFLNEPSSPLYGRLKVFVTDNGSTLDCAAISDANIHVCHNPNVGGAGGFARGLIEIGKCRESDLITNVIFMDDDVRIEPEAVLRTYRLLKLLKDEYKNSFIAGAMLSLDKPYIQHENGALWNMGKCSFVNRNLDLRNFENIVFNELEFQRDYAAWWYCCVPASVLKRDNLPIPLFIHEDDVEYSLRNAKHILTMNGIAIWHPVADTIRVSSNEYYNLRNLLIVNARYCPNYSKLMLCKKILVNFGAALLRFRYKDMKLILMAIEDFCKGPEWLLELDGASYHKLIQGMGYQLYDVTDRLKNYEIGRNAFYMGTHPKKLKWSRKRILFDRESGKGLELGFSFIQIFVCIAMYIKSLYLIFFKYGGSRKAYFDNFSKLQNIDYWEKALGM